MLGGLDARRAAWRERRSASAQLGYPREWQSRMDQSRQCSLCIPRGRAWRGVSKRRASDNPRLSLQDGQLTGAACDLNLIPVATRFVIRALPARGAAHRAELERVDAQVA